MKDFIATTPSEREMEATRRTKARPRFLVNSGWHVWLRTWNLRGKVLVQPGKDSTPGKKIMFSW